MTHQANDLPSDAMQSGATPDALSAATDPVHPLAGALQALLDSPNEATIGELAALIQSISRDLSFFPAALRDVIEPDVSLFDGPQFDRPQFDGPLFDGDGSSRADQPLGRKQLEALGDLLSAQAHDTNAR